MTRLLSGLILLAFFAFSTSFYQQFYIPKLIVFYGIATACLIFIGTRRQLFLPNTNAVLFIVSFLVITAALGIHSPTPLTAFMQWAFFFGGCLLFIALINLERSNLETLLKVVYAAALVQLVLVAPQFLSLHNILPTALVGHHERISGTVGNQEFLSALLGVGFFIGMHFHAHTEKKNRRISLLVANTALLLGLALAQNKGALLFIGLYFLWRRFPGYKLMLGLALFALLTVALMFPASINGRLLLWLVAATMYAQHFIWGVGPLQFENNYLDVVHKLFVEHPGLSQHLGSYTAMTMDAHNIFLHFGAELGLSGLLLSLLFAGYVLRLVKANQSYVGIALLFLLFKCLYTVVLTSITGMIILVLLLATLSERRGFELAILMRRMNNIIAPTTASVFIAAAFISTSDYFYQQGARSLFMGQNTQAKKNLNRAISINKENADAYLALAHADYLHGDYDGMRRYIDKALSNRRNKDTYKVAAYMFYYAKHYDDAFRIYQLLHITFPQHRTSLTKLATIYMLRHDYDHAYTMAQLALRIVPRKESDSDTKNNRIARQIADDSYPLISHSLKSNLEGEP